MYALVPNQSYFSKLITMLSLYFQAGFEINQKHLFIPKLYPVLQNFPTIKKQMIIQRSLCIFD